MELTAKLNKQKIIISGIILILLLLGITYAWFSYYKEGSNKRLVAGDVYLTFVEGNETINLTNVFPQTREEALLESNNYVTFTISGKNESANTMYYEIFLNYGNSLNSPYVRYTDYDLKFDLDEIDSNGNVISSIFTNRSYVSLDHQGIIVGTVASDATINKRYRLRMWLSEDVIISDSRPDRSYCATDACVEGEVAYKYHYGSVKVEAEGDFTPKSLPNGSGGPTVITCTNPTYNGTAQVIATCNGGTVNNATQTNYQEGGYTITCTPDSSHLESPSKTCYINKRGVTITADNKSRTYGSSTTQTYSYTVSNAVSGETAVSGTASYAVKNSGGTAVTVNASLAAGTYTITPSGLTAGGNYTIQYANGTLTVNPQDATCPTLTASETTYDGQSKTITVGSETTNGTIQYRTSTTGSWTTTKPTRTAQGTTTVYVQVYATGNYQTKDCGSSTIKINKRQITVTADNKSIQYGENVSTLTYTVSNVVSGETAVSGTIYYTITQGGEIACAGTASEIENCGGLSTGTYQIVPSGLIAGDNYTIEYVNGELTVEQGGGIEIEL